MNDILTRKNLLLVLIIILQLFLLIFHMSRKTDFFIDEVYTYSLSNSKNGIYFYAKGLPYSPKENLFNKWINGEVLKDYLTVSQNNRFDYNNVYINQIKDTHPPMYYYLIHTICSFFPEEFSKWFGLSINLFFFVITQILLYLICQKIGFLPKTSLFVCLIYGFSAAAINNFIFIRMYAMLTALYLLLTYLYINQISDKNNLPRLLAIFLTIFIGSLTQYHFLVFAFILTLVFIYITYKDKEYKILACISLISILAVLAAYITFPAVGLQIENSPRSSEAFSFQNALLPCFAGIAYAIYFFIGLPIKISLIISYLIAAIILFYSFIYIINKFCKIVNLNGLILAIFPAIFYAVIISPTINYQLLGSYSSRFYFPIFPFIAIVIGLAITSSNRKLIPVLSIIISIASGMFSLDYSFSENHNINELKNLLKNNNVICYGINSEAAQKFTPLLYLCNKTYLATTFNPDELPKANTLPADGQTFLLVPQYIPLRFNYPIKTTSMISRIPVVLYDLTNQKF